MMRITITFDENMFLFSEQIHIYRNAYPSRIKTSVPNGSNIDLIDIQ